eukprot:1906542-Amphidinium_carterae.1
MISRAGCCVDMTMRAPHKRFPFVLFKVVHNADYYEEVLQASPCLLDTWSAKVLEQVKDRGALELQQVLVAYCDLVTTNISTLETGHASIRRMAVLGSAQTWCIDFCSLSAQWVAQKLRNAYSSPLASRKWKPQHAEARGKKRKVQRGHVFKGYFTPKWGSTLFENLPTCGV